MIDNALRCIESDYPTLVALAQMMGVITIVDGKIIEAQGSTWDYIGHKIIEDGAILRAPNGEPYVHVNVRTPFSIGAAAVEAASQSPEIAAALGDPSRFFVTDGQGNAVDPQFPIRMFL